MADFKETLEVVKNSSCFMSFSFCKVQEDLATEETTVLDWNDTASIGEVADIIESFCDKEDKVFNALQRLQSFGKVTIEDEY